MPGTRNTKELRGDVDADAVVDVQLLNLIFFAPISDAGA
jgi:hypothetical protein